MAKTAARTLRGKSGQASITRDKSSSMVGPGDASEPGARFMPHTPGCTSGRTGPGDGRLTQSILSPANNSASSVFARGMAMLGAARTVPSSDITRKDCLAAFLPVVPAGFLSRERVPELFMVVYEDVWRKVPQNGLSRPF